MAPKQKASRGFTLIELLVVIAIIAILAGLLLPILARSKQRAWTAGCLSNLHQLTTCWVMYSSEHQDVMPPNNSVYDVYTGEPIPGMSLTETWCPGNARADTSVTNVESGCLFSYNRSVAIYRCPADRAPVVTLSGEVLNLPRTRSYNMSQSVNGVYNPFWSKNGTPTYQRYTSIKRSDTLFVFADVHEDEILDSVFGIPPTGGNFWYDIPANRHNQGGCFSFADGHAERWKWKVPKTVKLSSDGKYHGQNVQTNPNEFPDYNRVQAAVRSTWD